MTVCNGQTTYAQPTGNLPGQDTLYQQPTFSYAQLQNSQTEGDQYTPGIHSVYGGSFGGGFQQGFHPGYELPYEGQVAEFSETKKDSKKTKPVAAETEYGYKGAFRKVSLSKPLREHTDNGELPPFDDNLSPSPRHLPSFAPFFSLQPNPIYVGSQHTQQFAPGQFPADYNSNLYQSSSAGPSYNHPLPYKNSPDYSAYTLPPAPSFDFNHAATNANPGQGSHFETDNHQNRLQSFSGEIPKPLEAQAFDKKETADGQIQSIKFVLTHESYRKDPRLNGSSNTNQQQSLPNSPPLQEVNALEKAIQNANANYASGYHPKNSQLYAPLTSFTQQSGYSGELDNRNGPFDASVHGYNVPNQLAGQYSFDNYLGGTPYSPSGPNNIYGYNNPSSFDGSSDPYPESARVQDKGATNTGDSPEVVQGDVREIPYPGLDQAAYFVGEFQTGSNPYSGVSGQPFLSQFPGQQGFGIQDSNPGAGGNAYGVHEYQQQLEEAPSYDINPAGNPYGSVGINGPYFNNKINYYDDYVTNAPFPSETVSADTRQSETHPRHNIDRYFNPFLASVGIGYPSLPATLHNGAYSNPYDKNQRKQEDKRRNSRKRAARQQRNNAAKAQRTGKRDELRPKLSSFATRGRTNLFSPLNRYNY